MNRRHSIKFRPGAGGSDFQQRSNTSVLNTYDSTTDNDIFALGDAASGFNIDDLFNDFGMSFNQALHGQFPQMPGQAGPTKVSYQLHKSTIPEEGESTPTESDKPTDEQQLLPGAFQRGTQMPPASGETSPQPPPSPAEHTFSQSQSGTFPPQSGFPQSTPPLAGTALVQTSTYSPPFQSTEASVPGKPCKQDIQVSTITKTLPDGRTVQTRIVRGPVQRKARIIKVNRELPNGETELISTLQLPGDQEVDINETVKNILSKGGQQANILQSTTVTHDKPAEQQPLLPHQQSQDRSSHATEHYDNLVHENHVAPIPMAPIPPQSTHTDIGDDVKPAARRQSLRDKFKDKFRPRSRSSSTTSLPQTPPSSITSSQRSPFDRQNSLGAIRFERQNTLTEEDAIQLYKPDQSTHTVDMIGEEEESVCPKWCPAIWTRKKHHLKIVGHEAGKGRYGMTQSEINQDDKSLPGLQALVANYARMLYEDRPQFIQTLYRAVKLNKLDSIRILSKIIQQSGFKLGQEDLREPESSATVLHVALLYNHADIVDYVIKQADTDLLMAPYENEEYMNQTGLHVAVANGNVQMVEKLLTPLSPDQQQTLINQLADGHYFRNQHPYGQLCLTAAAWAGSVEIIKTLVVHGGNLALKNMDGNTLLHSIVRQSAQYPNRNDYGALLQGVWEAANLWADQMMYSTTNEQQRALEKDQMQINLFRELLTIRNNDGYTPLALATVESSKLVIHMLNLEKIYKIPQNRLGSVAWVTYDVTDITSFAYDTYNKFSMMHILAHNSKRLSRRANLDGDEEDLLDREPVNALVTCKWGVYRWIYIGWLIVHLSFMIIFTACTVETNSSPLVQNGSNLGIVVENPMEVHYAYMFFLILPVLYIVLEIMDLFGNQPYRIQFMTGQNYLKRALKCIESEWTITGNGPYRFVCMGFSYFIIEWFFLYASNDPEQDVSLSMTLLLGWIYVLFFTRACRITCRFSIMIQKMFFRDLIYFLTVYGIILIAFSFAMNSMFTYLHDADLTINKVFYDMMNVVTDLDKKQSIEAARHPLFARLLLIIYAIMSVILLMNMLIAMMNTSYETIRITRCNLWKQQQLSIMLLIERRLFWMKCLCRRSERDVWRKGQADGDIRCYLDVTVLHTHNYTVTSA